MSLIFDMDTLWNSLEKTIQGMINYFTDNLAAFIFAAVIFLLTVIAANIVRRRFNRYNERLQKRMRTDKTKMVMLKHVSVCFVYLIGFVLIFYSIPGLRALSTTLLASVGVLGLIVGMAAQDTFGNIISGFSLVFSQPFRVGDLVTVGSNYGRVTDINLRQTTILTSDDRTIIIPNSILNKETVVNWTFTDPLIRWSIELQVTNDSDLSKARAVLIEEAAANGYVLSARELAVRKSDVSEPVRARISGNNGDYTSILLDFWVNDRDNAYSAEYEIRERIKIRFDEETTIALAANRITLEYGSQSGKT